MRLASIYRPHAMLINGPRPCVVVNVVSTNWREREREVLYDDNYIAMSFWSPTFSSKWELWITKVHFIVHVIMP